MVIVIVSIAADDDKSSSTYKPRDPITDNTPKRARRLGVLVSSQIMVGAGGLRERGVRRTK